MLMYSLLGRQRTSDVTRNRVPLISARLMLTFPALQGHHPWPLPIFILFVKHRYIHVYMNDLSRVAANG